MHVSMEFDNIKPSEEGGTYVFKQTMAKLQNTHQTSQIEFKFNLGEIKGYNFRTWTTHRHMPWVNYQAKVE